MSGCTAPSIVPSPTLAHRLRALFDEAWRRARRRRLLVAGALVAAVAGAAALSVALGVGAVEPVGAPAREVDAQLAHRLDDGRMHGSRGIGLAARGACFVAIAGDALEERLAHLGSAGVGLADEEEVRHGW
jgi:hypothetical protein